MKIGIITLSASDNCGSLLQAYALKNILEKYGDVEIINFSSIASHNVYDVPCYRGIQYIKKYKEIRLLTKAKKDYDYFREEYLKIQGKEYMRSDLAELSEQYDVVVTGSDQVWNVQMGDYDDAFFLGWTKGKKIAYAPSLGGRHLNCSSNFEKICEWLTEFSSISVREECGKRCLEEVLGKEVVKVLDPTLVIDEEDWNQIVDKPIIKGDYIFYYSWAYCEDATSKIVSDEAKRMGMPVYVIDPRKWVSKDVDRWGFHLYKKTGPHIFLNLMKYAKKCYVESFHGMVFAYIFRKNFWLLDTHVDLSELDSRLMEFVKLLKVEDRIITEYNVDKVDQDRVLEYQDNKLLNELKNRSLEYLDAAFDGRNR